jgi:hypothetical protein
MLRPVPLVDQFRRIEEELPEGWSDARLELTVSDPGRAARAAALLAPAGAGRHGSTIRFYTARRGAGVPPDGLRRLLRKLDDEGIRGQLELLGAEKAPPPPPPRRQTLVESWDKALAALPSDWSELYCELELTSTDYLERAALLTAPLNPSRYSDTPGFRFRVASHAGYGAAPEMVRRCLQRLDEDGIRSEIRILRVLSASEHVATQGPVWYVGGKVV